MQVFEVLSEMLPRDASRIIAKKTLRFENEIILIARPKTVDFWKNVDSDTEMESDLHVEVDGLSEEDVVKLNQGIPEIAREYKELIGSALELMKSAHGKLAEYDSFGDSEYNGSEEVIQGSRSWARAFQNLKSSTKQCAEACYISHHFGHAVARYEPRTGWIHVKTHVLCQDLEEYKMLPKEIFGFKVFSDYMIRGTLEVQRAAINKQMECFEHALQDETDEHFAEFESYHNVPDVHEFWFRVPCEKVSPEYCGPLLKMYLHEEQRYYIVSRPQILGDAMLHHEMKVYIDILEYSPPVSLRYSAFDSTLQYVNSFGCCPNCFSKDHLGWKCDKPKYAFALAT